MFSVLFCLFNNCTIAIVKTIQVTKLLSSSRRILPSKSPFLVVKQKDFTQLPNEILVKFQIYKHNRCLFSYQLVDYIFDKISRSVNYFCKFPERLSSCTFLLIVGCILHFKEMMHITEFAKLRDLRALTSAHLMHHWYAPYPEPLHAYRSYQSLIRTLLTCMPIYNLRNSPRHSAIAKAFSQENLYFLWCESANYCRCEIVLPTFQFLDKLL